MTSHAASQPLRLLLLLAAVAGVLLGARTCQAASEPMAIPACVNRPGYDTRAGTIPIFTSTGTSSPASAADGAKLVSTDAANAACTADPNCIAFTNYGVTARLGALTEWASNVSTCSYVRSIFAKKAGYKLHLFSAMKSNTPGVIRNASSAAAAEAACKATSTCTAWSTTGQFALGPVDFIPSPRRIASHQKTACEELYGYFAHGGEALVPVVGQAGSTAGRAGSAAEALDFCKINFQCAGFSDDGSYVIGGVGDYVLKEGACSWVKNPCAPVRGFTAYNDIAYPSSEPAMSRPSLDCMTSVYAQCADNPSCSAFNNMRYMYGTNTPPVSAESTVSAPGMCLYVKMAKS